MAVRRYPAPERPRQGEADAGRNRLPGVRVKRAKGGEKAVGEGEGEAGVLLVLRLLRGHSHSSTTLSSAPGQDYGKWDSVAVSG